MYKLVVEELESRFTPSVAPPAVSPLFVSPPADALIVDAGINAGIHDHSAYYLLNGVELSNWEAGIGWNTPSVCSTIPQVTKNGVLVDSSLGGALNLDPAGSFTITWVDTTGTVYHYFNNPTYDFVPVIPVATIVPVAPSAPVFDPVFVAYAAQQNTVLVTFAQGSVTTSPPASLPTSPVIIPQVDAPPPANALVVNVGANEVAYYQENGVNVGNWGFNGSWQVPNIMGQIPVLTQHIGGQQVTVNGGGTLVPTQAIDDFFTLDFVGQPDVVVHYAFTPNH